MHYVHAKINIFFFTFMLTFHPIGVDKTSKLNEKANLIGEHKMLSYFIIPIKRRFQLFL